MYDLTQAYLLILLTCLLAAFLGALLLGGGALAPLAVKVLPEPEAARLLRAWWPRYFQLGIAGGVVLTLVLGLTSSLSPVPVAYTLVMTTAAGVMAASFYRALQLVPRVNAARDAGEDRAFDALHRQAMLATAVALLSGVLVLVALAYVLPGQYTVLVPTHHA